MSSTEFRRIARLAARFGSPPPPDRGIGDDAAVICPRGPLVVTVDASVEAVHFERGFASLELLSARAVEAAASDVAAMGADFDGPGAGLLLSWSLPSWVGEADFDALVEGAQRAAERLGARVLGGNLTAGAALALHTTALGVTRGAVIARGGAAPGDRVFVSGPCGAAAVGLRALLAGRADEPALGSVVARWRSPRARVDLAGDVTARCTAAIDVSDGLAQDAAHIAAASGVAITLDPARLPWLPGQREAAELLGCDAVALALTGGEDYELLVTAREGLCPERWSEVGEVTAGAGVWVRDGRGDVQRAAAGWDHFATRAGATAPRGRNRG
jgi:thiamine-monophosphate kinase